MGRRTLWTTAGWLLSGLLLAGCQVGGSPVSERQGYFTWVDEQGRVRYSPIVEAPDQQSPAPDRKITREPEAEYTLENYPDAEQLRKEGYVRPGERQPYFTWRDANGNVRVSYYRPDTRTDAEKGLVEPPVRITPASVYHGGQAPAEREPVPGYDPDAFAILGIEPSGEDYMTRFSEVCCQALNPASHHEWQSGREFGVRVTDASPVYPFPSGDSPYELVALPDHPASSGFLIRIHSYAHDGVFVPSFAFLDEQRRPVRLVTDLVMAFTPETWHRRGYLSAWVPVFPGQGERWLLVFTRSRDLRGQTVIETPQGPESIPHVTTGELGLKMLED
ncbi:MAG TPA: MalM family protein [Marinobacter sp.]|uniref:MalM family protein n=1 Tax=Marinobacter sp. TaxID=50741 RepID=UPI002D80BA11|nr:MalM family protein [Marinobacter sp.]HET8800213.1 MalM family protein [Marinobacter sp.]